MFRSFADTNDRLRRIKPKNCTVSTMTVCGKVSTVVDVDSIWNTMEDACQAFGLEMPPESPTKRNKGPARAFCNQFTVKSGSTSVKIFSNGSISVTGIRSPVHCADVLDRVCCALGHIGNTDPPDIESLRISMINANFCASARLPLRLLRQALEEAGHAASYDPDAYPGVNAKIAVQPSGTVTVMIFTSGNVIISGAKTPEHVAHVYQTVCTTIDSLEVKCNESTTSCSPAVLDSYRIVDGYSSRLAYLCLNE